MNNLDLMLFGAVIFSLLVLMDLIVPLIINRPSFSLTMLLGEFVDYKVLSPCIRWILIKWYQWQYERADEALNYARKELILVPDNERWYWMEIITESLRERNHAWNRLCEVRDVHDH